jgi:hypothetical protein
MLSLHLQHVCTALTPTGTQHRLISTCFSTVYQEGEMRPHSGGIPGHPALCEQRFPLQEQLVLPAGSDCICMWQDSKSVTLST